MNLKFNLVHDSFSNLILSAAWLKSELEKIYSNLPIGNVLLVEKLTGNNTREEKDRVLELFKDG